jgi:hypothetical protein
VADTEVEDTRQESAASPVAPEEVEEEAVEEAVDSAAAAAPLSQDRQDPRDRQDPQEAMASPADPVSQDRTLRHLSPRDRASRATAAASQPATDPQAHQDLPARTATPEVQDRTRRAVDRDLPDPQDLQDPTGSQEAQASPADPVPPVRCTRLPAARDPPAHQAQMDSPEAPVDPETMASPVNPAKLAHQETLEALAAPEIREAPASPEAMARAEARVAATTAHHPAPPLATKRSPLGDGIISLLDSSASPLPSSHHFFSLTAEQRIADYTVHSTAVVALQLLHSLALLTLTPPFHSSYKTAVSTVWGL